jgi:DHA1 family tetracycline resistance protein-like MFS transporter
MKGKNVTFPIFLTVFLDMLGVGIIIPIIPSLFLDFNNGFLPTDFSMQNRNILLGFLLATYSFAQFFGSPVLGALSDNKGRKPILTISLIGTMIGYLLFAVGLQMQSVLILFLSRLLDGFTGGNISIAFSVISDVSDEKSRAKNFGMVGAAFGLGFILGPYIGGKLADPTIISWFNIKTPFYFAALLSLLNIISVKFNLPETLETKNNKRISFDTGFKNIIEAFSLPHLRKVFITVFLITLGFNFFTTFFQVFCFHRYHWNISEIGDFFAYIGLWIVIAQAALIRPLTKRFKSLQILKVTLFVLSIALVMVIVPDKPIYAFLIAPFIALSQGISGPNITSIVSGSALPHEQGKILGINQSVSSLAMTVPPIIAGFATNVSENLPCILASIFTFFGWLILNTIKPKVANA